jgi:hypothetical protein
MLHGGGGGHVVGRLVELDVRNITKDRMFWGFGDGGEVLSGWVGGLLILGGSLGQAFVRMDTLALLSVGIS